MKRLIRFQLTIFAIVTVVCVGAISAFYLHVPSALGIGSYNVTANFVAGGGLYQNANVTYRGVTVGRVESVGLTNDGIVAAMRLNSGTPVPDNVTATVKSVSAVGEQYIDLVPPDQPSRSTLRNNSTIDQAHTLRSILFQYHVGDTVTASVLRSGQTLSLKLTLHHACGGWLLA